MASINRYAGKPMLRLLECYVLWSIGELGSKEEESLTQMEPKLRQVFNHQGNWHEIVGHTMALPGNMPELIRTQWAENQQAAAKYQAITLTPQQFAEGFVDSNLIK